MKTGRFMLGERIKIFISPVRGVKWALCSPFSALFAPRGALAAQPCFRVRIDPDKSGETDQVLRFDFPDGKSAGLHVRRAVAEFIEDPAAYPRDPDIVLKLSPEAWAKVYLSAAPLDELVGGKEIDVTQGDAKEAARVLSVFDRYDPERAVVVPPTTLVQGHM
jgi:hypothetical protein